MTIKSNTPSHLPLRLGAGFALIGVALGAFGAHGLKEILLERDSLATWKTAVAYQMWHALALVFLSLLNERRWSAICFSVGIVLFAGSLYWLSLGGPSWLGPVTPLGGFSLMAGWVCLLCGK